LGGATSFSDVGSGRDNEIIIGGLEGAIASKGKVSSEGDIVAIDELEVCATAGGLERDSAGIVDIDRPWATRVGGNGAGCGSQDVIRTAAYVAGAGGERDVATRNGSTHVGDVA